MFGSDRRRRIEARVFGRYWNAHGMFIEQIHDCVLSLWNLDIFGSQPTEEVAVKREET